MIRPSCEYMSNRSTDSRAPTPVLRWILDRLAQRWRGAAAFAITFRLLQALVFAPLLALVLRLFLLRWGRASVGNFEIAAFLLSPTGIVALLCVGALFIATIYFEVSGLIRILANDRIAWWRALSSGAGLFPRLAYLGFLQLVVYLALAAPFLGGIALAYWWFWSGSDLNGLVILRPPHFWKGATIAGVLAVAYLLLATVWFCRWLYAVPMLCVEPGQPVVAALRESARRSRGTFFVALLSLLAWAAAQVTISAVVIGLVEWLLFGLLQRIDVSPTRAWAYGAIVLVVHAAATSLLAIVSSISYAAVLLALHRRTQPVAGQEPDQPAETPDCTSVNGGSSSWPHRFVVTAIGLVALASIFTSPALIADLQLTERIEITAHRAGAAHGPENTIAALKQAIVDRADWAEIDVQLTADNELVVMHDTDLARIGGGQRRVDQATLAEIQALDVGSSMNARFAGEKVPLFRDLLAAAKGQIKLNVELKPHSIANGKILTPRVVQEIQRAGMVAECRICSQSYESIQLARELEPRLPIGLIVATAIGDPTRLPVDFLMVKTSLAKRDFVDRAHAKGIQVHVWTVNNPSQLGPLIDAGVDNVITDDSPAIRAKINEIGALQPVERILLRVRHAVQ